MKITTVKKVILLIVFFYAGITIAQTPKDTLVAYGYFKKADSLLTNRNYTESIALFNKALPIYKKAKAWERVASCYNKVSENRWRDYELEKSSLQAEKALKICETHLTNSHPELANAYDNIGACYLEKGDYKNVLPQYEKALVIRKKRFPELHVKIAKSYFNIGFFYYMTAKNQNAIIYYKKALTIYKKTNAKDHQIRVIYNSLANAYNRHEKYDIAINYLRKALTITLKNKGKNHLHTSFNYINIGDVYRNISQLNLALEYAKKALPILKKEKHSHGLSIAYQNIGVIYHDKGEFDKALQYFKKSLQLKQKKYGDNHPEVAEIYRNIGIIIQDSDLDKSLHYFKKALHIYIDTFGENHYGVADAYESLGVSFLLKKEYKTALKYYYKSLKIRKHILDENHREIANSYYNLGDLYNQKGEYLEALNYYKKSLSVLNKLGMLSKLTSECNVGIGNLYFKQQDYNNSLAYYDKALLSNQKKNTTNTFNPDNYHFKSKLFETLLDKSEALKERYKKNQTKEDINQAIEIYKNLDLLIDLFRQSYHNYQDKVHLAKQAKNMYTDAIETHLLHFKATNNLANKEKAFYYIEKSKSNILKELLNDTSAKNFSKLPEEILTLESTLKSKRAFYQSQITNQQAKDSIDTAFIKEYEDKLFDTKRSQDSLVQILEKEYPKYYQLKHNKTPLSTKEIQGEINEQTTFIEFFVTDSITYAFCISKNNFSIKELPSKELDKKIGLLNTSITSENSSDYQKIAHQLYQELVLPIKENIIGNELIIIPDGALWHLNFDLLLTKESVEQNARNWPYLLKDYAVSYASSAHLLFNTTEPSIKSSEQLEECLAFSFSNTEVATDAKAIRLATLRDSGDDLPGTREEIRSISEIFDGQYYYGTQANEANFKENADRYKIIHLALHGEVDDQDPQNSKLYFNKSNDAIEDNLLYAHELFALNVPAELTVLSACNTGTGKIANGEGIMSLGNAFQYAGTKSLLLSNWEVSDKTTPTLMKYFYTNLKEGMNKAKALQQAKLKYLNTTEAFYTHPFYWGSFYVLGDTSPITSNSVFNTTYFWGFVVLLCLLIVVYFVRKKKVAE